MKRIVLIEKYINPHYIESDGTKIWVNRYGEIVKKQNRFGLDISLIKMRAHWTPELAQDLEAYHSIDAEAELTALISESMAREIDREIVNKLAELSGR